MAINPARAISTENIKIRFKEEFASQGLNKRFMGTPTGIYTGFQPSVSPPSTILTLFKNSTTNMSLARVVSSGLDTSMIDIVIEENITLDFSGHATFPIYVVASASYSLGATTSANIFTTTTPPDGVTTVGICRIEGSDTNMSVFFADEPDRHEPIATNSKEFGFMPTGSVESLNTISAGCNIDPSVRSSGFTIPLNDAGKTFLLDMSGIVGNQTIQLPASGDIDEGSTIGFFNLTTTAGGFDVVLDADGSDVIMVNESVVGTAAIRKFAGHHLSVTLVKSGLGNPTWLLKDHTLKRFHGTDHTASGADSIKLDDLDAPDDNTDLDVSTSSHGLMPKLNGSPSNVLLMDGTQGPIPSPASYAIDATVVTGNLAAPSVDGRVYLVDHSSGGGTITLPSSSGLAHGSIIRFLNIKTRGTGFNTTAQTSGSDLFLVDNINTSSTSAELNGIRGAFTELVILKDNVATPIWTVSSRMRDEWSVLPAGSTSAEINAVLNDVSKRIVYLLPGEYILDNSDQIIIPDGKSLTGLDYGSSEDGQSTTTYPSFKMTSGTSLNSKIRKEGSGTIRHLQVLIESGTDMSGQAIIENNAAVSALDPVAQIVANAMPLAEDIKVSSEEFTNEPFIGIFSCGRLKDCTVNTPSSPLNSIEHGIITVNSNQVALISREKSHAENCRVWRCLRGFSPEGTTRVSHSIANDCAIGYLMNSGDEVHLHDNEAVLCSRGFDWSIGIDHIGYNLTANDCTEGHLVFASSGSYAAWGAINCVTDRTGTGWDNNWIPANGETSVVHYVGNDTGQTIICGFQPDFVIIQRAGTTGGAKNVELYFSIRDSASFTNGLHINTVATEDGKLNKSPGSGLPGFQLLDLRANDDGFEFEAICFKSSP